MLSNFPKKKVDLFKCLVIIIRCSQSESIRVDLGWEALVKLVNWFYSGKLVPKPKYSCVWHNLDEQQKLNEVIPYVELYCLSDSWLLEDIHKECLNVIASCLDSASMAIKIIQIAADCFQWDLVGLRWQPNLLRLHIIVYVTLGSFMNLTKSLLI